MKKFIILSFLSVILFSCDVVIIEPVYDDRNNVLGTYQVEEYSQTYSRNFNYQVSIRRSSYGGRYVVIDNFYDEGISVRAEVNASQIYIPSQTVDGYLVEGSGNIFGGEISLTYRIRDTYSGTRTDFCEARLF
jgi:hypothetical protein